MAAVLEYKCPACGGGMSFDSSLQKVKCPYCDTEYEMETLKELDEALQEDQEELSWEPASGSQWKEGEEEVLRRYICQSCGGEIITDATTAASACPYCDNPVVMAEHLSGSLRPDCLIPFKLDKKAAEAALKKHLSGKLLLPKVFKDENHIREIKGIYVPFWLYDAQVDADFHYRATRLRHWSDSNYSYTETTHFSVRRGGELRFSGVPVDGSAKMEDALMESIEPYDLSEAVDFQTAYLAGYFADRYDVAAEQSQERANERIRQSTRDAFLQTVHGYASVMPQGSNIRLSSSKIRYALLPVWVLNTQYRGENYIFAMNGQTGRFVGNLPVDKAAYWKWWALAAAAVSALSFGIGWLAGLL